MVKAIASKKRGPGKAVSADSYRRQLTRGIAKLGDEEVLRLCAEAANPAFVSPGPPPPRDDDGGESVPTIDFYTFADCIETLDDMLSGGGPIEAPNYAEIGAFIGNHGTKQEIAETMLTLLSVGKRVFLRYDAAKDACLAEPRAAKGKKQ